MAGKDRFEWSWEYLKKKKKKALKDQNQKIISSIRADLTKILIARCYSMYDWGIISAGAVISVPLHESPSFLWK